MKCPRDDYVVSLEQVVHLPHVIELSANVPSLALDWKLRWCLVNLVVWR